MTKTRTARELFGEHVRDLRQERALTQSELAERMGVPQSRISEMESGTRAPNLVTLLRLAAALECKPTALLAPFDKLDTRTFLRR
jgi:transcriptional regulator with XRE-family HTH domain